MSLKSPQDAKKKLRALPPFIAVAVIALAVLAADQYRLRPHQIEKPATADSLAGVIARVFPGRADSSDVARMEWWLSPERILRWVPSKEYAYRGAVTRDLAPIAAEADLARFRVTFANGQGDVELVKHEMTHLMLMQASHPEHVFKTIEEYRGR